MATEKENKRNLLERFDNITLNLISSNAEEANAFLKEEGFDPAMELQYGLKQIQKLQFLAKAQINKEKNDSLLEDAFIKLKQSFEENAQKTGNVLMELLVGKRAGLQYRKLEKWTDNEIRDVLNDIDLVSLLEQLEKD